VISKEYIVKNSQKEGFRVEKINQELPGNNCGACGNRSCYETAEKIAEGEKDPKVCDPLDEENEDEIREFMK